ncbi:hypothetical protein RRF57_011058 [Xylaria bambusicola]|uniref:Uncharacterized protein n=1 Tax=Xylaria bambusicola TaxID=326684 RepID=A0AAN7ZCW2_9PEZI
MASEMKRNGLEFPLPLSCRCLKQPAPLYAPKGGHNITASFTIDGAQRQFIDQLTSAQKEFTSRRATLNYEDSNGLLRPIHITLHCQNDITISGSLNVPVEPVSQVGGSGM